MQYQDDIKFLKSITEKNGKNTIIDLKDFFNIGAFYRKIFNGKLSIKSVLPSLDSNFSYKSLNIQNGVEANSAYLKIMNDDNFPFIIKKKILSDLVLYCELDTFAMIIIFQFFWKLNQENINKS
ncbi:hypothetical protein [Mycoplasma sp. SG1]|uniref:hypothetical protein n=1 Tax=Mycoplasma sp. SG1 TaxID=2810348 RepID=UPI002025345B|nr:hypothetical protein [Mycoplasma sp. SG1]